MSQEVQQASFHVADHAGEHVRVTPTHMLGIIRATTNAISRFQRKGFAPGSPGTMVHSRLGHVIDTVTLLEQPKAKVIILGSREACSRTESLVKESYLIEYGTIGSHVPRIQHILSNSSFINCRLLLLLY